MAKQEWAILNKAINEEYYGSPSEGLTTIGVFDNFYILETFGVQDFKVYFKIENNSEIIDEINSWKELIDNGNYKDTRIISSIANEFLQKQNINSIRYDDIKERGRTTSNDEILLGTRRGNDRTQNVDISSRNSGNKGVNFSKVEYDSKGRKLSEEQQALFKDSKVRDENGNLEILYHGTEGGFNEFDSYVFLTNNLDVAKTYSGNRNTYAPEYAQELEEDSYNTNYKLYANITNPYVIENGDWEEITGVDASMDDMWSKQREFLDDLKNKGYDGLFINNIMDSGLYASTSEKFQTSKQVVAFEPSQVKSVNNQKPTSNPDIRYSVGGLVGLENLKDNPNRQEDYKRISKFHDLAMQMRSEMNADGTSKYTEEEVRRATGWYFPEYDDTKERFEFYDDDTINKLAEYVEKQKGIGKGYKQVASYKNAPTLSDIVGKYAVFFDMYPGLRDIKVVVANRSSQTAGFYSSQVNGIMVNKKDYNGNFYPTDEFKNTFAHEIGHIIQDIEGFTYSNGGEGYRNRPGEIESFEIGDLQVNPGDRKFDVFGDTINLDEEYEGNKQVESNTNGVEEDNDFERSDDTIYEGTESTNNVEELEENSEGNSDIDFEQLSEDNANDIENKDANASFNIDLNNVESDILGLGEDIDMSSYLGNDDWRSEYVSSPQQETQSSKDKVANVLTEMPAPKDKKKTKFKEYYDKFKDELLDHAQVIRDIARKSGSKTLQSLYDNTLTSYNKSSVTLLEGRYDLKTGKKIGESLADIQRDINKTNKQDFFSYMYHLLNIDRMTLEERYGEQPNVNNLFVGNLIKNKPVFGNDVTAEMSRSEVARYESEHPEFKELSQRCYDYIQHDLDLLIEGGIVSKEQAQQLREMYPHYVPIVRIDPQEQVRDVGEQSEVFKSANQSIKRAKGGNSDIAPLDYAMSLYTQHAYSSNDKNKFYNDLGATLGVNTEVLSKRAYNKEIENLANTIKTSRNITDEEATKLAKQQIGTYEEYVESQQTDLVEDLVGSSMLNPREGDNPPTLVWYKNGKKQYASISDRLYNALAPRQNPFGLPDSKVIKNINDVRRNLITNWNPLFAITNGLKDIQDGLYNTKNLKNFAPSYVSAWKQILNKGDIYNLYVANGGLYNSYNYENALKKIEGDKPMFKALNTISKISDAVEMAPRLAEFIATMDNGGSIEDAMYNASEITTNFKRGGDTAKFLDRNGATFLNASIQGALRQVRNVQDAKDKGSKAMLGLMAKTVVMSGVPLLLLNGLLWKDDDEYEQLSDYIKSNYYIIGKYDDGKFIRIPKGRVASFYQEVVENGVKTATGKAKLWDAIVDDYTSLMDNVAPNNPLDNNIISPLIQASTNRNWYGEDLVPTRLQDEPTSQQYDETTDLVSKAIGKGSYKVAKATGIDQLELSPYKINYVLDQYSGVFGDVLLPIITPKATQGTKNPVVAPFLDKFTTDSYLKNQAVTDFYSLKENVAKEAKRDGQVDEVILSSKYLNSVSSTLSGLYADKREIQNSNLDTKEKYNQSREVQKQIDAICANALANYDQVDIDGANATVGDVVFKKGVSGWTKVSVKKTAEETTTYIGEDGSKIVAPTVEGILRNWQGKNIAGTLNDDGSVDLYEGISSSTKKDIQSKYETNSSKTNSASKKTTSSESKNTKKETSKKTTFEDAYKKTFSKKETKEVAKDVAKEVKKTSTSTSNSAMQKAYEKVMKSFKEKALSDAKTYTKNMIDYRATTSTLNKNVDDIRKEVEKLLKGTV